MAGSSAFVPLATTAVQHEAISKGAPFFYRGNWASRPFACHEDAARVIGRDRAEAPSCGLVQIRWRRTCPALRMRAPTELLLLPPLTLARRGDYPKTRHFVLPDAHLPYVYRRGLKGWQDVDDWLRGAVLEDENPPEDEEGVDNEEEPEGDTSRVMMLLLYVAPTRDISEGFDAPRRKAARITGRWGLTSYQGSNHGVVLGCGYWVVMRWLFGCYFVVIFRRYFAVIFGYVKPVTVVTNTP